MSDKRVEQDIEFVLVDDPEGVVDEDLAEEAAWAAVSGMRPHALLLIGTAYYASAGRDQKVAARINNIPIQGFNLFGADPAEVNRLAGYLNEVQALGEKMMFQGRGGFGSYAPPRSRG